MRVLNNLAGGGVGKLGASASRGFLILLGATAIAIGLGNLFIPTSEQAASVAAMSGRAFLDMLRAFDRNPLLIRVHACVGISFIVCAALQFWPGFRARHRQAHRRIGYAAFACVVCLPATGLACAIVYPFAGVAGIPPNVFWLTFILTCALRSWRAARAGDIASHEIWITRATAMSMGAVSLFSLYESALVHWLHMDPHAATAVAFWCGQGDGLLAAQIWLLRKGGPIARRNALAAARS
jgi:uncharacterized membrane protein